MRTAICFLSYLGALAFSCSSAQIMAEAGYSRLAVISREGETVHLSANDPRPLAQALDALQRQYGWLVNYEDPRYLSKLDLVEVSNPPQQRNSGSDTKVHYPNGGAFSLDFRNPPSSSSLPDEQTTLQLLVDTYNQSNNPGRFELRKTAEQRFDIVGTAAHDAMGRISPQEVLLDSAITLSSRRRNALETIKLICSQITDRTGTKVAVGVFPMSLRTAIVEVGGSKLPARTLLFRTLTATGRKFTWRMLFDPNSKSYFLRCLLATPS